MTVRGDAHPVVAGVDEAGRGPLAGPVVAAAVVLGVHPPAGLADSKRLGEAARERLFEALAASGARIGVGLADAREIERVNILQASLAAMRRAVDALGEPPDEIVVDGLHCPQVACRARAVVGGDATVACVSAASIVAKVTRDRLMRDLDQRHPGYGFARHKGYPTREHLAELEARGPCAEHRRTYAPVRRVIDSRSLA